MKRNLIYCLTALSLSLPAAAQDNDWKFQVSLSPAVSWSSASEKIKPDGAGFSFDMTVSAEKYFRERYAFYAGISYISIGGKFKNSSNDNIQFKTDGYLLTPKETAKYAIQYLTVPVGLKFVTQQYGNLAYYFQGGLLPGIKVGNSVKPENGEKRSFSEDINLMSCAVQLSSGCLYSVADNNFVRIGLIFNRFFTDAFSSANMKTFPTSIGIVVGYVF